MGDHTRQKTIRGDIEGHTKAHITGTLIQLTGQFAIFHVELAERVARGQGHLRYVHGVPRAHDYAPVVRVVLDLVDAFGQLVHTWFISFFFSMWGMFFNWDELS